MFPAKQFSRFPIPKRLQSSPSTNFLVWQLIIIFDLMLIDILSLVDFLFSCIISGISAYFLLQGENRELDIAVNIATDEINEHSVNLMKINNLSTFRIANHKGILKLSQLVQLKNKLPQLPIEVTEDQFTLESNQNVTSNPSYIEWVEEVYYKEKSILKMIKGKPHESNRRILGMGLIFIIFVFNSYLVSSLLLDANIQLWQLLGHFILFTILNLVSVLVVMTDDLISMWHTGEYMTMNWTRGQIESKLEGKLILNP